ncbi:MAG: sulfurtransferase TusA family protein [Dehalococcoidia bacterium]|nr:MAG: sulfurtransferase TusA family protein [Dehalococcoidia bacterium]
MVEVQATAQLDVRGKKCPEPNMMIKSKLDTMNSGDILEVIGDMENKRSIERFIKMRGHETISVTEEGDKFRLFLKKAEKERGDRPVGTCGLK